MNLPATVGPESCEECGGPLSRVHCCSLETQFDVLVSSWGNSWNKYRAWYFVFWGYLYALVYFMIILFGSHAVLVTLVVFNDTRSLKKGSNKVIIAVSSVFIYRFFLVRLLPRRDIIINRSTYIIFLVPSANFQTPRSTRTKSARSFRTQNRFAIRTPNFVE